MQSSKDSVRNILRSRLHIIPGNHDADISEKSIVGPNIHIYTVPTAIEIGSTTFLFIPYEEKTKMGEQIASLEWEIQRERLGSYRSW